MNKLHALLHALLIALMLAACAPDPASSVSFTSGFTDEQLDLAHHALGQWCEAVGWCPIITLDGELHVKAQTAREYARHGRKSGSKGYHAGAVALDPAGRILYVDTDHMQMRIDSGMSAVAWIMFAHELGHDGIDHTEKGLMRAAPNAIQTCVDSFAVQAWCEVWGCPQDAASTCTPEVEARVFGWVGQPSDGGNQNDE